MAYCATLYNLDPERFQALCIVESRATHAPDLSFRIGRLGHSKCWGPGGINQDCAVHKELLRNPYTNILIAARTMRRLIDKHGTWKAALKKYNAEFDMAYYREIKRIERKLEKK
jgi:hypothetical protein